MNSRLPVAQRRVQLVDTALAVAVADGIAAVTVRRVAEEAGVALGVVHYCFADKDELLAALAERIVQALAQAGASGLAGAEVAAGADLGAVLRGALHSFWATIEASRSAQLLTYEITTVALRTQALRAVADRQYLVSQAAVERVLDFAAAAAAVRWRRPLSELAAGALAHLDGVTLRWLVDGDGAAALTRLDRYAEVLAGAGEPLACAGLSSARVRAGAARAGGARVSGAPVVAALTSATADLDPPLAALDLVALRANAADLVRRAGGTPVRVASKSVRCRHVLELALATPGFRGVMAYSVREALWLVACGVGDVLLGYPSADRAALADLAGDPAAVAAVTLMLDSAEQLRLLPASGLRVCLDIDASLRVGRMHLGVRRSPLRTPRDAAELAREARRCGARVVGVMFYEAQIAGLPDTSAAVRLVKRRSAAELAVRRAAVVNAVTAVTGAPLEIVNSGGTGSLKISSADPVVSEVTAGSGLYVPTLFDRYDAFAPRPAMFFALPVVRRPARDIATLFGGGYIASGPAGKSRVPRPVDADLALIGTEGAGEVQTPVRGRGAQDLRVGDRVWFRHAKAGELCERFDTVHLVEEGRRVASVPTYRGEGRNFG